MKSKTKVVLIVLTVLLIVVITLRISINILSQNTNSKTNVNQNIVDITVVGTKVKVGDIEKYISLSGEIRAVEEANAFPDVSGKIDKILVTEGDYVKKDRPIMYIDRSQIGFSYNLSPVRSPISGKVGNINVSEGQFVLQTTPVATIVNDSIMEIVLLLPETYLPKINKGLKSIIQVTPYSNKEFIGYIYSIDTIIDKLTKTLKVKVRVKNPERKLISGMYCNVKIPIERVINTTYVPNTSIRKIDNEEIVYIATKTNLDTTKDDNLYYITNRKIKSSVSDGKFTAVKGVQKGEIVVSLGAEYLKDGIIVRLIEE